MTDPHRRDECPYCVSFPSLTPEQCRKARMAHDALIHADVEISKLQERVWGLQERIAPIVKSRARTLRELQRALGLTVEEPATPVGDLWARP